MDQNDCIYAPVIIPTLCRFEHFKRCIESLARCTDADKTELYIGLDYPTKDSHWNGYNKISNYLDSITGFKQVFVVRHEKNMGPTPNADYLRNWVKKKYDRYICSEDDEEFSPNFLLYMNSCLEKYREDPNVIAVCSYNVPRLDYNKVLRTYSYNAFPMHGNNAHASGLWFDKKIEVLRKDQVLSNFRFAYKAIRLGHPKAIRDIMVLRNRVSQLTDIGRQLYCAFENKYSIFPRVSKVRNWGFDGSGENSEVVPEFEKMIIDDNCTFVLDGFEIKDYPEVKTIERRLYGYGKWYMNVYVMLDYIFLRLFGCMIAESKIGKKCKKI